MTIVASSNTDRAQGCISDVAELYLWIQYLPVHLDRLRGRLAAFPIVRDLRVSAFEDERSTASVIRLRFRGRKAEVIAWAEAAGFQATDASCWPASRHEAIATDLAPLRSPTPSPSQALAIEMLRLSCMALQRMEPNARATVEICESLANTAVAAPPRRFPRGTSTHDYEQVEYEWA